MSEVGYTADRQKMLHIPGLGQTWSDAMSHDGNDS